MLIPCDLGQGPQEAGCRSRRLVIVYHVRFTTRSVSTSNALLASLSGSISRTALALSACVRARSLVRLTPEDLRTRSLAYRNKIIKLTISGMASCENWLTSSTSPSCSNFRSISGPISACSSQAYRAGPVARPKRKSAPPGLPSVVSPDS